MQREALRAISPLRGERGQRGGIFSFQKENIPPFTSPKRKFTLRVCSLKSCTRCAIGCGVHGFAMNPYYPLPIATAPYYREARVTAVGRQTACGMRHCWRSPHCGVPDRRELLRTSTRWAERQRIIGAEANRIATLNAAMPRAGKCNRQASQLFELLACNVKTFLLGDQKGEVLFCEREPPPLSVPCAAQGT